MRVTPLLPFMAPDVKEARAQLNAQIRDWRNEGRSWVWIKQQPAWLAFQAL